MESLTTCSICYGKYSQNTHVPLVLTCGHTFCKECVSKVTKCPYCRKIITSTTTNLIIFQITYTNGGSCEHKFKRLFCPACACAICISCVPPHNMHGIIPFNDPALSASISDKLSSASEKLNETNNSLKQHLQKICELKKFTSEKEHSIKKKINKKFDCVFQFLTLRKQEILDEYDSIYKPISSKIDTLIKELEQAIQNNINEIKFIQDLKNLKIKSQIKHLRAFKVKFINPTLIEKIADRASKTPLLLIDTKKLLKEIKAFGTCEQYNSRGIFGFKFM